MSPDAAFPERSLWLYAFPYEIAVCGIHPRHRLRYREFVLASADGALWMAGRDDVVVLHARPEDGFISYLAETRGFVPEIHVSAGGAATLDELAEADATLAAHVAARGLRTLIPFIPTERTDRLTARLGLDAWFAASELVWALNSKVRAYELFAKRGSALPPGAVCTDDAALTRTVDALRAAGIRTLVLKPDRAAGGHGIVELPIDTAAGELCAAAAKIGYPLIAEARLRTRYSAGFQLHVERSGAVRFLGATRQRLLHGFRYNGAEWPLDDAALALHERDGRALAAALHAEGFFGMVGFDAIVGELHVPAIEINARFTASSAPLFASATVGRDYHAFRCDNFGCPAELPFAEMRARLGEALIDRRGPDAAVVLSCAGARDVVYPTPSSVRLLLMTRDPGRMDALETLMRERLCA